MDREKILLAAKICTGGEGCSSSCPLWDVESRCTEVFAKFIVENFPHIKRVSNLIGEKNIFCSLYENEKKHSENLERQIEILESQIENPILTRLDAMNKDDYIEKLKSAKSHNELTEIQCESDIDPNLKNDEWYDIWKVYRERLREIRIEV